jgi:hypothetical protein
MYIIIKLFHFMDFTIFISILLVFIYLIIELLYNMVSNGL